MIPDIAGREARAYNARMRFTGVLCRVVLILAFVFTGPLPAAGQNEAAGEPSATPEPCTLFKPQSDQQAKPDDASLAAAYASQARSIHSLRLFATVRASAGPEYRIPSQSSALPVILDFDEPNHLRVRGAVPFVARRGFEMASDGREFELLIPDKGRERFLVGSVDTPPDPAANPRENLRPQLHRCSPLAFPWTGYQFTVEGAGRSGNPHPRSGAAGERPRPEQSKNRVQRA
jgi:hypothetical protein